MHPSIYRVLRDYFKAIMISYVLTDLQNIETINHTKYAETDDFNALRKQWFTQCRNFLGKCPEILGMFRKYPSVKLPQKAVDIYREVRTLSKRLVQQQILSPSIARIIEGTGDKHFFPSSSRNYNHVVVSNTNELENLVFIKKSAQSAEEIGRTLCALDFYLDTTREELDLSGTEKRLGLCAGTLDKMERLTGSKFRPTVFDMPWYSPRLFKSSGDYIWLYRYLTCDKPEDKMLCLCMIGCANAVLYEHILSEDKKQDILSPLLKKHKSRIDADFFVYYNTGGLLFNTTPVVYRKYSKKAYRQMQGVSGFNDGTYYPLFVDICAKVGPPVQLYDKAWLWLHTD